MEYRFNGTYHDRQARIDAGNANIPKWEPSCRHPEKPSTCLSRS